MIFEGEYISGERNGKGKEYYSDGELLFEGEYLNGKKWNGKGYNENGYIAYELKNGNGFVKEFCDNDDDLLFEGEYKNGEKNGKGILSNYYGIEFEGEYLNGKNWNGKMYDTDGNMICELNGGKGLLKRYNMDNVLEVEEEYLNGVESEKLKKI